MAAPAPALTARAWLTIALVWLDHVTVTGAELFQSAGHWGFMSDLTDADQRAEYQGAAHIGGTLGGLTGRGPGRTP